MHAAAIGRFGGVDEIRLQMLPVPQIGPSEILIRVESVGVGVWDVWEREGLFRDLFRQLHGADPAFPYVIGFDGAGTVVAVGEAVTRFAVGDRVYADRHLNPKGGFYAQYVAVTAEKVSLIPDGLNNRFKRPTAFPQPPNLVTFLLAQVRAAHVQLHLPVKLRRLPYLGRFVGSGVAFQN
jgi:NADPH:quinone reductase-like Zn-dependent oxidoreductase